MRWQVAGHSTHVAFRSEVHYPWHPARGVEIEVHYREKRGGEDVYVCTIADDTGVVVPAWMFDQGFCSQLILGTRRTSTAALRELRGILDEIRSTIPSAPSGRVPQEVSDDETQLAKATARRAADPDRISDGERAPQCTGAGNGPRAAQSSASSSRVRTARERGGR